MFQVWGRPSILPSLDLRVTISEGEPSSSAMVTGGEINHLRCLRVRIALHLSHPKSVVDAVLTLIQKHPGRGGAGINHITQFQVDSPAWPPSPVCPIITSD